MGKKLLLLLILERDVVVNRKFLTIHCYLYHNEHHSPLPLSACTRFFIQWSTKFNSVRLTFKFDTKQKLRTSLSDSSTHSSLSLPLPFPANNIPLHFPLYRHISWTLVHIDKISKAKENFKEVLRCLKQKWRGWHCSHKSNLFQNNTSTTNERE